ncbi:MAG TPA: HoxN/HupN/NixA family nickel/cobalt transporter [Candidatus Dormibacteraeota bacterium]
MAITLARVADNFDRGERRRLGAVFGIVVLLHVLGWGALLSYGVSHPAFIGLGGLAYVLGLRHAFDADHISAIDNTTRKLLAEGKKPVSVGFFFSLGHSTVVLVIAALLGLAVKALVDSVISDAGQLRNIGGLVGTSVSGVFLVLIGILNLLVLLDIIRVYRRMKRGQYDRDSLQQELVAGGFFVRLFGGLFRFVDQSWHIYPIGFLFGLGFDTASEVAFLAISAGAAAQHVPFLAVISLAVIFAAGMSLMDSTDGAFMAKAYSWAFSSPIRKVFYNLTVTGLSVFVALFVGGVELGQLMVMQLRLQGQPWTAVAGIDFSQMGFIIVGAFVATWVLAFAAFKLSRVEERWEATLTD